MDRGETDSTDDNERRKGSIVSGPGRPQLKEFARNVHRPETLLWQLPPLS